MNTEFETLTTAEQKSAIAMQETVFSNSRDINNFLTTSGKIKAVFHTHFEDMTTGESGIADLIARILRERTAYYKSGIEKTDLRPIAIAGSMFTHEIIAEVQARFSAGSCRYPDCTIQAYLSVFMFKQGKVGKIQLISKNGVNEDPTRECCKPRCKWYLID